MQAYYDDGHGFVECARRFGFSHTAWTKAIKRGALTVRSSPFRDRRRKYDWIAIQAFYDLGNTYRQTAEHFGFCPDAWYDAVARGEIEARPRSGMPIPELLASPRRNRSHVKVRLIKAGLLQEACQQCGLSAWRGKPLSMHLDHTNGIRNDHRLENLRMLCPNCHSQTPTFSGRNVGCSRMRRVVVRKLHDWGAIQRYYDTVNDPANCRVRFGIAYGAWAMALRRKRLNVHKAGDGRRRHDWQLVQEYYDQGHSFYACMKRFNFCRAAWHKAVRRGEIRPRPLGRPLHAVLAGGGSRRNVKLRLLRAGVLTNRCTECGLSEWLGKPLVVQIDHINGIRNDHRLENLRMLCPNCHSQTATYGKRNSKRASLQDSAGRV